MTGARGVWGKKFMDVAKKIQSLYTLLTYFKIFAKAVPTANAGPES